MTYLNDFNSLPDKMEQIIQNQTKMLKILSEKREVSGKLLTRKEAKEKLRIGSDTTMINLEKSGFLNAIRVGKKILYPSADIEKIISKQLQLNYYKTKI